MFEQKRAVLGNIAFKSIMCYTKLLIYVTLLLFAEAFTLLFSQRMSPPE